MLTGVALGLVTSVTATGLSPAAAPEGVDCGFRITAVHVLAELSGDDSPRAEQIRQTLIEQGVNKPGFVPEACYEPPNDGGGDRGGQDGGQGGGQDTGGDAGGDQSSGGAPGGGSPPAGGGAGDQDAGQGGSGAGQGGAPAGATAAEAFGWGEPDVVDDFDNGLQNWNAYDGPGHAGKGRRTPEAASVQDGMLTINGTPDGTTAGLAWTGHSQKYGRWEGRVKAPKGSKAYNALLLLWPTEENFPVGGEVDFMEIMSPDRNEVNMFLHYGQDNSQVQGKVNVDATQWHNWAVEWTPEGITTFLDGKQWWKTTDTSILPPGPMHLCIQLDWFPEGKQDGQPGEMHVDWVKQWSLGEGEGPSTDSAGSEGSTDADSSTSLTEKQNNQG